MSNEEIVRCIQAGENTDENTIKLWDTNKGLILLLINRFARYQDTEDLEQEAFIALLNAIRCYDANKNIKFISYLSIWVERSLGRYLDKNGHTIKLPMRKVLLARKYRRFISDYESLHSKSPTVEDICSSLEITEQQLEDLEEYKELLSIMSLDNPLKNNEDSYISDTLIGTEGIEDLAIDNVVSDILWDAVDSLKGNRGKVLRYRYQNGLSKLETAEKIGVSRERVRQIENRAIEDLREKNAIKLLLKNDESYSGAYLGNGVGTFNRTWTSSTEREALKRVCTS